MNSDFRSFIFGSLYELSLMHIKKLSEDELLMNEPPTEHEEIRQLFYLCRFLGFLMSNSEKNIKADFEKVISSFNRTVKINEDICSCLFYILIYYLKINGYKEAVDKLKLFQQYIFSGSKKSSERILSSIEIFSPIYGLILCIYSFDIKKSFEIIENINRYFYINPCKYPDEKESLAYFFISLHYFIIEEYKISLDYLVRLSNF